MGSFFPDPEDVKSLSLGGGGTLLKGQGSHDLDFSFKGHKGPVKGLRATEPQGLDPLFITFFYSNVHPTHRIVFDIHFYKN
jgi:hypothetical protein